VKNSSRFSKVLYNNQLHLGKVPGTFPRFYRMGLRLGALSKTIEPGQFFTVRCSDGLDPILRRPFGVHRIKGKGVLEILYKVVGDGTELLSRKKTGDVVDIIGPLGNGFPLKSTVHGRQSTVLVAGGHGVAPLVALAEKISRSTAHGPRSIVIGAKTAEEVVCEREFEKLGFEVLVATEDGSKGKKGLVTDLLKNLLPSTVDHRLWTIYACGPNPMLKTVAKIAKSKKIRAFGSFEEHLACGVGSCYGCVIKTREGYKRVCKDGPVFDLKEIKW